MLVSVVKFLLFVVIQLALTGFCESSLVVLVTGSSSGIGRATVLDFAKQSIDFKVYASMRSIRNAPEEFRDLENVHVIAMDVTDDGSVTNCVETILDLEGKIDIVVNNAGYGLAGTLESVTIEEAQMLFEVNVWGVVRVLQAVLPGMRARKSGHVINISSTSGVRGVAGMEYYTGSKFALEGLMDSFRYTEAAYKIKVTNVNAGPVLTSFTDVFGNAAAGGRGTRPVSDPEGYLVHIANTAVETLVDRMNSAEVQKADDVGMVIVNIAKLGLDTDHIEEVPFNTGTSRHSMAILDHVRQHPTGWGGMFSALLARMPRLQDVPDELKSAQQPWIEEL